MDSMVALSDLQLALESVCGQQSEEHCTAAITSEKKNWEMSVIW